jgi:uncharacterized protein (TIGR03067 family)
MRAYVLASVTLIFTATVALAADEPAKEWEKLQGKWKVAEKAGKADYPWDYIAKNGWVVIAKDKATLVIVEGDNEMKLAEFAVKIDPSKSPKSLTLTIEFIAPEGEKAKEKGTKLAGVYALDGDTIKIMLGDEKNPPKSFPAKGDEGVTTLQREKRK